ncbi:MULTISPECIES: hypothetical protein [unclassified Sphingomonas]|uniref:hypothetical protein n=1 Tax=unclassified Sphingomonas TaxID=196159 RepID=UPI00092669AB|nr:MULTISPECIES: hypothetical protein [unclassified Sphingomonas]MBN8850023.1 hypothetical protein [Sphingomonas sp.]MBS0285163.1 hypothetical protein [Pseudomonadota bacterium]OJV31476.1 MAG: hypothetical protein BGO24_04580 [Sphingomonas sp. 67-36]
MGLIDTILSQLGSNVDVANLAAKVGLSQDQVEQAIAALSHAHTQDGDTVDTAAETTGLPADTLQQIVGHIGGEGSLGQFAQMIGAVGGEGGEGGAGGLLSGLAGKLFGRG